MKKSRHEMRKLLFPYMETPTFDSQLESTRLKFDVEYHSTARKFLSDIGVKAREKIYENVNRCRVEQNPQLFKKVTDVLWEFRTNYQGLQYRLLAFWDKRIENRPIVRVTHGFIKKTGKIPSHELKRARSISKQFSQNMGHEKKA
ncbi:MAG TPA: type II toxin-antitoxin system RelE/ParE family toxin [Cyclobacteriaceae bacterium]|nr:type II toxin-antitoxin system RelE/ParE family toxin [Cyclobacteriaceae bacterium]